jgi:hypothetical protein
MRQSRPASDWLVAIFVIVIFSLVAWVSNLEKGLAAGVTFGVFAAIVQSKWASRGNWLFWAIIAVFAALHIALLFVITFPQVHAGLISLPFALVDGFFMWGLINWVEKHSHRASKRTI